MGKVWLRRVYQPSEPGDGARVLVDRLWPRGVSRQAAQLSEWLQAVAPSTELRRWFAHQAERFAEFEVLYRKELAQPEASAALAHLKELAGGGNVTLLTASRDLQRCHGTVLAALLGGAAAGEPEEEAGDPACWLHLVCANCGAMIELGPCTVCPRCGAEIATGQS